MAFVISICNTELGTETMPCYHGKDSVPVDRYDATHEIVVQLQDGTENGSDPRRQGWGRRNRLPICPEHKRPGDDPW